MFIFETVQVTNHEGLCGCVCLCVIKFLKRAFAQGQQTSLPPIPIHVVAGIALV